jgi:hypothetical protein
VIEMTEENADEPTSEKPIEERSKTSFFKMSMNLILKYCKEVQPEKTFEGRVLIGAWIKIPLKFNESENKFVGSTEREVGREIFKYEHLANKPSERLEKGTKDKSITFPKRIGYKLYVIVEKFD